MSQYYTSQSPTTDSGEHVYLLDCLPTDLAGIAAVTQGLIYHYASGRFLFGWEPPKERIPEINTRTMRQILPLLMAKDDHSLPVAREYPNRMIGCCRDFSLIACAILRHQGRAARLRYGFASYFEPGYWVDHVIVETWTGERWQRFDPQLAGIRQWGVDLLDLPDDAFVTGGRAWLMCRREGADPDRFGLGPNVKEVRGWWFIRERLRLDVASLQKIELLCWDTIEGLNELEPADAVILDEMATLSLNPDSDALRQRCASDPLWQIPATVSCFHPLIGPAFPVAVA
jgi:hypothetical protein